MDNIKPYDASSVAVKKLPDSEIEITASIPADIWGAFRQKALKNLNESITMDGFRKGNIPESILISKVGEMAVLEEMAELAIPKAYIGILIDQKIDALGQPRVSVTKLAAGNPLEFKAVTSVMPEISLPDYKKLAAGIKKEEGSPVTEKEIDEAVLRVRRMHASHEGSYSAPEGASQDKHDHANMTPEEHEKAIDASLPELTDDFVKKIGDFNDVPDFKTKLSNMLAEDKKAQAAEKRRIAIADAIADKTKVSIPKVMVESELDRTQAQFGADIERMGVKLDDYLKHAKKSLEDIRKEWLPHAEKKAKLQIILNEIAKKESLKPSPEEVEAEVDHILQHYKDADRGHAAVYAETVLTNEKVFKFLEG